MVQLAREACSCVDVYTSAVFNRPIPAIAQAHTYTEAISGSLSKLQSYIRKQCTSAFGRLMNRHACSQIEWMDINVTLRTRHTMYQHRYHHYMYVCTASASRPSTITPTMQSPNTTTSIAWPNTHLHVMCLNVVLSSRGLSHICTSCGAVHVYCRS